MAVKYRQEAGADGCGEYAVICDRCRTEVLTGHQTQLSAKRSVMRDRGWKKVWIAGVGRFDDQTEDLWMVCSGCAQRVKDLMER